MSATVAYIIYRSLLEEREWYTLNAEIERIAAGDNDKDTK